MCSGATFKALCYFYAGCNLFMSITAIMNSSRASEMIGRDNCTASTDSTRAQEGTVVGADPSSTCNQITFAFLLLAGGLNCIMSLVLTVGIVLRKTLLLKLYMVHLWCHMAFCFYCWLAVLMAFRVALASPMLLSVWGVVLILAGVYFAMEVWITRGAYEAIWQERAKRDATGRAGDVLLSMGGFIF